MNALVITLLFILGASVGSFLNVVVLRMRSGTTLGGRSMCMVCGKTLKWYELIPIMSFLVQNGRCRECHSRISEQYVIVELLTAVLFVLAGVFLWSGDYVLMNFIVLGLNLIILSVFVAISVYDYLHKIIPDQFVLALIALGILLVAFNVFVYGEPVMLFIKVLVSGLVLFLPFFLLWAISKGRWIGLGDGKLAFAIGVILPFPQAVSAIVLAFWIGAAFGIIYMYTNKLRGIVRGHEIPFGPFMILGTLIALFYPLDLFSISEIAQYVHILF